MAVKFTKPEINVREKLAELDKPSGIAGEAMLRAETVAEQQALIGVGRRNLLINGSTQVSQRGTSFTSVASGETHIDQYYFEKVSNLQDKPGLDFFSHIELIQEYEAIHLYSDYIINC